VARQSKPVVGKCVQGVDDCHRCQSYPIPTVLEGVGESGGVEQSMIYTKGHENRKYITQREIDTLKAMTT
jgi:hypothetical protein